MARVKAILFDIDLTLLDTHQFIYQGFVHAISRHKLPLTVLDNINSYIGVPLEQTYASLAPQHNTADLAEAHRSFQEENLHLSRPFPNTLTTLQTLKNQGIKLAAITSRSKRTSVKTLELAGITPYMEILISQEDLPVHELKPHPRPLLLALKHMSIDPEDAIMVGDAAQDIEAGKRAGTGTVGVTYGALGEKIKESNPDFLISDIADIVSIINNKTITR